MRVGVSILIGVLFGLILAYILEQVPSESGNWVIFAFVFGALEVFTLKIVDNLFDN